jgi:hypothetical protein
MRGHQWGQTLWGTVAVPAVGFWAVLLLLGAVFGIAGVLLLRGRKPRTIGIVVLALAVLIPISVRAVDPFTNGTVAGANQVDANLEAVTPVTGFFSTKVAGPFAATTDILTPTFVAPRAMTCLVHLNTRLSLLTATPSGVGSVQAIEKENNVVSYAYAPPAHSALGMGMGSTAIGGNDWSTSQTRLFTVASGATVAFGCRASTSGDFQNTTKSLTCVAVYECF